MSQVDKSVELRRTFAAFPTGVTTVAAIVDGAPVGFTLSSFTNVSLEPALVLISPSKKSNSWAQIKNSPTIGVSILSSDQEDVAITLSKKNIDRFAAIDYRTSSQGALFIEQSIAWFETRVVEEVAAGDHIVVILEVLAHGRDLSKEPLVHHSGKFRDLNYIQAVNEELPA